jgi:hypothetical protein
MKNTTEKKETVTVDEMKQNLLAMMETCFDGDAERVGDSIRLRLSGGEEFLFSVMGVV